MRYAELPPLRMVELSRTRGVAASGRNCGRKDGSEERCRSGGRQVEAEAGAGAGSNAAAAAAAGTAVGAGNSAGSEKPAHVPAASLTAAAVITAMAAIVAVAAVRKARGYEDRSGGGGAGGKHGRDCPRTGAHRGCDRRVVDRRRETYRSSGAHTGADGAGGGGSGGGGDREPGLNGERESDPPALKQAS
jgi:hypothetical protein